MRSFSSAFNLFTSTRKPSYRASRYPIGVALFMFALLISTASIARGQALTNAQATSVEPGRAIAVSPDQFSDSNARPVTDPATILRNAKLIYIRKKSVYFKAPELENELRKRTEFQRWGLAITRNEADADLIIEVGRKVFTTRFVYTVIDPRTNIVVTTGKLSSVGGTLSTKIAKRFIEQMQQVRP
ncbi:MAG: hypothetical protein H0U54_17095 [Acidobacteria bacterium]|nr:hypothetical protein [Acidobacteriota bacterium]